MKPVKTSGKNCKQPQLNLTRMLESHLKNLTVACDGDLDGEFEGSVFHDGEFDGKVDREVDGPSKFPSRCPSRQNRVYFDEMNPISQFF